MQDHIIYASYVFNGKLLTTELSDLTKSYLMANGNYCTKKNTTKYISRGRKIYHPYRTSDKAHVKHLYEFRVRASALLG